MTLASWPLEPEEVKRREYFGMAMFVFGVLSVIAGIVSFVFDMPLGAMLTSAGLFAMISGPLLLESIPIVAKIPE